MDNVKMIISKRISKITKKMRRDDRSRRRAIVFGLLFEMRKGSSEDRIASQLLYWMLRDKPYLLSDIEDILKARGMRL